MVDAALVVAALVDAGPDGAWAEGVVLSHALAAPHLLPVEVAGVLRRAVREGALGEDAGSLAHADLLSLRIELFPYEPFGPRVWELRGGVTAYDAWYVALAEHLEAPLATLDRRLARCGGARCAFRLPALPGA